MSIYWSFNIQYDYIHLAGCRIYQPPLLVLSKGGIIRRLTMLRCHVVQLLRRAYVYEQEYFFNDGTPNLPKLEFQGYHAVEFEPFPDVAKRQWDLDIVGTKTRYGVPTISLAGFPPGIRTESQVIQPISKYE
jgi:hypothetical protein